MQIEEIRKHFQKQTITKDSVLVDGDTVVNFASYQSVRDFVQKNLPEGVSYITKMEYVEGSNVMGIVVMSGKERVWDESYAMPLNFDPIKGIGYITMAKKALILSAFDIAIEEGETGLPDVTNEDYDLLVQRAKKDGFMPVVLKAKNHFNMTSEIINKLRKDAATRD